MLSLWNTGIFISDEPYIQMFKYNKGFYYLYSYSVYFDLCWCPDVRRLRSERGGRYDCRFWVC